MFHLTEILGAEQSRGSCWINCCVLTELHECTTVNSPEPFITHGVGQG